MDRIDITTREKRAWAPLKFSPFDDNGEPIDLNIAMAATHFDENPQDEAESIANQVTTIVARTRNIGGGWL